MTGRAAGVAALGDPGGGAERIEVRHGTPLVPRHTGRPHSEPTDANPRL